MKETVCWWVLTALAFGCVSYNSWHKVCLMKALVVVGWCETERAYKTYDGPACKALVGVSSKNPGPAVKFYDADPDYDAALTFHLKQSQ